MNNHEESPISRHQVSGDLSITLRKTEKNLRDISHEVRVRLRDFSSKGFGIFVSYNNRSFFRPGDQVWITAFNQEEILRPLLGTICYVTRTSKMKNGDVQVGISLQKELSGSLRRTMAGKVHSSVA